MYIYVCFTNGGLKNCLPNRGALEVVRESILKIDAISFFADIEHKWGGDLAGGEGCGAGPRLHRGATPVRLDQAWKGINDKLI